MDRLLVGLTGAFGSGTTFLAEDFFAQGTETQFEHQSLSSILKKQYFDKYGKEAEKRRDLQNFGNELREQDRAILARMLDETIISKNKEKSYVIDSIKNPAEIKYFREKYPEFILIGVFADYDTRWGRVKETYKGSKDAFDSDEQKDKGTYEPKNGQKMSDCFFESDLILSNNEEISCTGKNKAYFAMRQKIDGYLMALRDPSHSNPTLKETLMAAAYTSGRRSRCIKRKVGAIIADRYDRIISSGFNGVPQGLQECKSSIGECYRDRKRAELGSKNCKDLEISEEAQQQKEPEKVISKNVKLLELCRALHGEESAILNLVGRSADLTDSTIYVTTYPCNLCAN